MMSVGSSNWAGARAGADHLLGLGHRRIAWIGGPEPRLPLATALRLPGRARRRGVELDPALVRTDQFDVDTGAKHARDLLTTPRPPTAIMTADDEIAVGVLATAHELGVTVPEQLSVVGFDDTPQAAWTTPALTTVRQDLDGMGAWPCRRSWPCPRASTRRRGTSSWRRR